MCGIAGYSLPSGCSPNSSWINFAKSRLIHRGPDDHGVFEDKSHGVGLLHTRLSILDTTAAGHQPMISSDGDVCLVFNGEIYNYRSLRRSLELNRLSFNGTSDTEVLLSLYVSERNLSPHFSDQELISKLLNKLNGIFSFALLDLSRKVLFVARDSFGIKPLYYLNSEAEFFFSSELKALPSSSFTIDPVALDRYLTYLWSPGSSTPAAEVKKLGPGQALCVYEGSIMSSFSWFSPPEFKRATTPSQSRSLNDCVSTTEHYLRQAVHRQLVSDVPLGAFLSGGLDSSSVVAFAKEQLPDIQCFTIDLGASGTDGFEDDLPYATRVAHHLDVPLEVVSVDASCTAESLEQLVWQLDEPLADLAPLNVFLISQLARQHGIKVLLSGAGGDDLFTGYRRHTALRSEKFWSWLPRSVRLQLRNISSLLPSDTTLGRRINKAFSGAHLSPNSRLTNYFRWIDRADLSSLYTPAFQAALLDDFTDDPLLTYLDSLPAHMDPIERMLSLEKRFFLADHNLIYTDKMSMAAGVEVRVPFLDSDLVDIASHIPSKYKHRYGHSKFVLKKAMEPYLPRDVIYRPKTGFGSPVRQLLRGPLKDWLTDTLSYDRLHARGLFIPSSVHRLISLNSAGASDYSYTLLSLAFIEIWCTHFIDNTTCFSSPKSV